MKNSKNHNVHELLLVEVMRTSHLLIQPISPVFKKFDLTQSQYNILRILRGASPEPISAGVIKERMVNPKSDVTRLMDRLVAKGLINRHLKKDNRRQMDIAITKNGVALLEAVEPELKAVLDRFQSLLKDKKQIESFLNYLEIIQEETKRIIQQTDD